MKITKEKKDAKQITPDANLPKKYNLKTYMLHVIKWFFILFLQYIVVTVTAVYGIPITIATLAGATGITKFSGFIEAIAIWLFPSAFMILIIFMIIVFICKMIYRNVGGFFDKKIAKIKAK